MKNSGDISNLITGNTAPECREELYSIVREDTKAKDVFKKAKIAWALLLSSRRMPDYEVEKSYQKLHQRISTRRKIFKLNSLLKYAAVMMMIAGIPVLTFHLGKQTSHRPVQAIRFTSIVADKGQISKVVLPDSSIVWLNSGTTMTYDNNYSFNNRNLNLSGQAFLEVRKNKELPLVVASGNLRVKVLGTRFDVDAYPDDRVIKVTLESGKVELLNSTDDSFNYKLNPGEMAEYESRTGAIKINRVASEDYSNWTGGRLIFVDTPMAEVLKRLKRKFDIEIEVHNSRVYRSVFNANFKDESLREILDYIQFSCPITYRLIPEKGAAKTKVIFN